MGKISDLMKPRIFISHAWEDKALVHRLESALKAAGAEVWVDHAGIRGGDNLPKQINDALDWCNTLLLVWSKAAEESHWVELEWTNAISLRKHIIPGLQDGTPLPPILANRAYVNFANMANCSAARAPVIQTSPIPQTLPKKPALIQLRRMPINPLSEEAVKKMLWEKNFYDKYKNASGKGITHQYESIERQGANLVLDHATGLMWQEGGSENYMSLNDAAFYIQLLNAKIQLFNVKNYGGYNDWRLPTLEEAMSLMEHEQKNGDLYIDPVFDKTQRWFWTGDIDSAGRTWCVYFYVGTCSHFGFGFDGFVRAVRS